MNPSTWMNSQIPGYRDLTVQEKRAIRDFAMLWSFFEERWLGNYGNAPAIADAVAAKRPAHASLRKFQPALAYFRSRYFADGHLTDAFRGLRLGRSDKADLLEEVLSGATEEPTKVLTALLIIVYRLRNNFLHGEKWAYGFRGQLSNFQRANDVMMLALEL